MFFVRQGALVHLCFSAPPAVHTCTGLNYFAGILFGRVYYGTYRALAI